MKKKIAVLAGICMLVSVQGTVFAADRNSPDDLSDQTVQSVIRARSVLREETKKKTKKKTVFL